MGKKVDRQKDVVETVYGKHSIFEIVKTKTIFSTPEYMLYKNGKFHRGAFSSLRRAVEIAHEEK